MRMLNHELRGEVPKGFPVELIESVQISISSRHSRASAHSPKRSTLGLFLASRTMHLSCRVYGAVMAALANAAGLSIACHWSDAVSFAGFSFDSHCDLLWEVLSTTAFTGQETRRIRDSGACVVRHKKSMKMGQGQEKFHMGTVHQQYCTRVGWG